MGTTGRAFVPVPARPPSDDRPFPEWLVDGSDDGSVADAAERPDATRDHVLTRAARPEPRAAADIVAAATPLVDRLAPALRRFRAPRRVWMRRAGVAGVLVGSCAVLVSGIILTGGGSGVAPAPASDAASPVLAKAVGAATYLVTFPPPSTAPSSPPAQTDPPGDETGSVDADPSAPSAPDPVAPNPVPPAEAPADPVDPVDPSVPPVDPPVPPLEPPFPAIPSLDDLLAAHFG